jgi:uncharacterized membrane protein
MARTNCFTETADVRTAAPKALMVPAAPDHCQAERQHALRGASVNPVCMPRTILVISLPCLRCDSIAFFISVPPRSGAERIFAQFEAEGNHRRELGQRQSKFVIRDVHIGQFLAGLFALSGLGVAAFAIYMQAPWAATIIGGGTIGPIVYAFPVKPGRATKSSAGNHLPPG